MEKKSYYRLRKEKLKRTGYYVYVYLDPRKKGSYTYDDIHLEYEPFYVGKGYGNRIKVHLYEYSLKQNNQKNNKIKKIINEGLEPIRIKLFIELTEIEALEKEIEVIEKIGLNVLTNVTKGGRISYKYIKKHLNKGRKHSEETKNKISEKLKNRVITEEWKNKISNGSKGKKKVFTEEHKNNIGKSGKGRTPWNKGLKTDKPSWNKGKIMSEEARKNMSKAKLGKKGVLKTEESKRKIYESLKKYYNDKEIPTIQ